MRFYKVYNINGVWIKNDWFYHINAFGEGIMCKAQYFLSRIITGLLVLGLLLSLGVPQPAAGADGTVQVIGSDGARLGSTAAADPLAKIEPQVLEEIQASGQTDFFVWLNSKADLSSASTLSSQESKGEFVFSTLESDAHASQLGVAAALAQAGVNYESYYIVNRVLVHGGSRSLALELASRPDVQQVTANHTFQLDPLEMHPDPAGQAQGVGSNLSFIKVDQVWAMGYTGTGIVIANQDTGVQWDHPAIKNHYRGWNGTTADHNYNWWDATGTYPTVPNDDHGHGTHTSGTLVGDDGAGNQIGVAPGAKTIHCKSFTNSGSTTDANVLTCFQWFLAPWDLNHLNPNPAKAPNIINNSWGWGGGNHLTFAAAINTLQAAGILVEASAGNAGSTCQTLGSPGDYDNVLTTGAVDYSGLAFPGTISSYSSRGPSKVTPGSFMPDVMAPGSAIRSSLPGSTYGNMNGTSMAGPHVSGLVALIWQAAPYLKGHIPETIAAIKAKSAPLVGQAGSNCGGNYTTGPNNDWGMGTIDAKAIIDALVTGTLSGTVTITGSSTILANATIIAGSSQTTSGVDGKYSLNLINGTYSVTFQKGGYVPKSVGSVVITANTTTTVSANLALASAAVVSGTVRDGTPGGHTYPLYAKISFATPGLAPVVVFSNPFTGMYRANLLQSVPYTASITPTLPGYLEATVNFTASANPFTQNFTVQANLSACSNPGYSNNRVFTEAFDSVAAPALPAAWSTWQVTGTTGSWTTTASSTTQAVSSPNMAVFNSYTATSGDQTLLHTNSPTSLASLSSAYISFWMYHDSGYSSSADEVWVAVSTDGTVYFLQGSPILRYSATPGWVSHQIDISSYAGPGKSPVYIGIMGTSGYGNNIYIDDVAVADTCVKVSGGIVSGYVRGAMSGRPIVSAAVSRDAHPAEMAYSASRGEDPSISDGFYQLFSSGTGAQNFWATALRYAPVEAAANVANEGVIRLDLAPTSAFTSALPNPVTVNLSVGATTTFPLVISNTSGALPAAFTLQPAASALTSGSTLSGSFPTHEERSSSPADTRSETSGEPTAAENPALSNPAGIQGGGPLLYGVMSPFPGAAGYRFATASCNGETFYVIGGQTGGTSVAEVWMYSPADNKWVAKAPLPVPTGNTRAACIDGNIYVVGGYNSGTWNNNFQIYDTLANSWTLTTQPITGGPMLVAYNGLLYALGGAGASGAMNQASAYNPVTASWSTLASLPTPASYAGAVVYKDLIFIIGGADTADVQVYNPASNTWNNSGPDLPGPRMDPVVGWYGDQIYLLNGGGNGSYFNAYPEGYILNASAWPGGSWTMVSSTLPSIKAAPASICADNRLRSVGGTVLSYEKHITQYYDAGLMCNRTYPSVPWLTVTPQNGTAPAGGTKTVTLGFNASIEPYNTPGVYRAILKFNSDAPTVMADIPVTMVVVQTNSALSISPASSTKPSFPHKYASFRFTITNKSGATDDFTVVSQGITAGWTAMLNSMSFPAIPNNGTATLTINLYPPAAAKDGDQGSVCLAVKVHDNASKSASLCAMVNVQYYKALLPHVVR